MTKKRALELFDKKYPPVEDVGCNFENGDYSVGRSKSFLAQYKKDLVSLIKLFQKMNYPAFSYSWLRALDDGGSLLYGRACRVLNICPVCFQEWGQPYYTLLRIFLFPVSRHCKHGLDSDDGEGKAS